MNNLILTMCALIFLTTVKAQEELAVTNQENPNISRVYMINDIWTQKNGVPLLANNNNKNTKVADEKLLNESWSKITIYPKSGKRVTLPQANYNMQQDAFVIKTQDGKFYMFDNKKIDSVTFNTSLFKKFENSQGLENFYSVLLEGENQVFLKRYTTSYVKSGRDPMSHAKVSKDKQLRKEEFYIYRNQNLIPVKLKKSKVLAVFPDKQNELKAFAKENNLSFSNEKDVIKLIAYYNSI